MNKKIFIKIMKKHLFLVIITIVLSKGLAQNSPFSVSLSYPVALADGFFNEYTGIADFGFQSRLYELKNWQFGVSFNSSYFIKSTNFVNPSFTLDENILLLQPKLFTSFKIGEGQEFKPFFTLGYSLAIYGLKFQFQNGPPDENEAKGGINIGVGATIEISKHLFLIAQYDYIDFNNTDGGLNLTFSNNFGIAKAGLGYRF